MKKPIRFIGHNQRNNVHIKKVPEKERERDRKCI